MTGAARADQWLAAAMAAPKKLHRPDADAETKVVSAEIQRQVKMDMARTAAEEEVAHRRQKVTDLMTLGLVVDLVDGAPKEPRVGKEQLMKRMAMCFREVGDENATLHVFDYVIRQDRVKRGEVAWEPVGPEDVDVLLDMDLADKAEVEAIQPKFSVDLLGDPLLGGNMPPVQLEIKRAVRMPRRWQPWKFITVAIAIPWLLMHATRVHQPMPNLSKQVAPPMLRKASLPPVLHFVPMHEANWPK
eukprot:Skav216128  [mRNA]  locus=scaffold1946:300607:304111:+ [translate_table: standard]